MLSNGRGGVGRSGHAARDAKRWLAPGAPCKNRDKFCQLPVLCQSSVSGASQGIALPLGLHQKGIETQTFLTTCRDQVLHETLKASVLELFAGFRATRYMHDDTNAAKPSKASPQSVMATPIEGTNGRSDWLRYIAQPPMRRTIHTLE